MHNIKLTTDECFELVEILKIEIQHNQDLISIYEKLSSIQISTNNVKHNYDYEISEYKRNFK